MNVLEFPATAPAAEAPGTLRLPFSGPPAFTDSAAGREDAPRIHTNSAPPDPPPDAPQRAEALDISRSWLVEAPAGSGKTGLLIQRYLKLLASVDRPETVLALTFTNKATAEMRSRVLAALARAEHPPDAHWPAFEQLTWEIARDVLRQDAARQWALRAQPHRLNIRTIDSLCGEIARAVPVLSGGLGSATPMTDAAADALYRQAARAVLLRLGGEDLALNAALETVLLHRDGDLRECERLLAEMLKTREQWSALVPLSQSALEDAALEEKVLPRLNAALDSIICGALSDLRSRFPEDLLQQLADFARRVSGLNGYREKPNPLGFCEHLRGLPGVHADDLPLWTALSGLLLTNGGTLRQQFNINHVGIKLNKVLKAELEGLIGTFRDHDEQLTAHLCALRELPPSSYPPEQWRVAKALFRLLHHALMELRLLFAERDVCDFAEISIAARAALRNEANELRITCPGMELDHLLVDEMQDTSTGQYELLEKLTSGWNGRDQTVFLVGDPKQSIYLFRQARVERFMEGMRTGSLGGVELSVLQLSANFRSGAALVSSFNQAFATVFAEHSGGIGYKDAIPVLPSAGSLAMRWHVEAIAPGLGTKECIAERRRLDREEAESIVKTAHDWLHRPLPAGREAPWRIAVLVRVRGHALHVMRKLKEANVPFRAVDMEELGERPEVLDAIALTRALLHPADRVAWLAVLRAPWCGLSLRELHLLAAGDQAGEQTSALRTAFRNRAHPLAAHSRQRLERTLDVLNQAVADRGRSTVAVAVEKVWASLGGDACTDSLGRTNVRRYLEMLASMEANGEPLDAAALRARVSKLYAEPASTPGAVDVMTIHKAKGLEWDLVLLPGLQRTSRRDATRLLDWMELPARDRDGQAQILLAPVPSRQDEPGSLNTYISSARSRQISAELKRLFYVATTRARSSVQLFASPGLSRDGAVQKGTQTLLGAAWPVAKEQFAPAASPSSPASAPTPAGTSVLQMPRRAPVALPENGLALAAEAVQDGHEVERSTPLEILDLQELAQQHTPERSRLQRLPLAVDARAQLQSRSLPREPSPIMSHRPTTPPEFDRPHGSFRARGFGNTVHAFLEHLSRSIAAFPSRDHLAWIAEVQGWSPRIRAVLRGAGLTASEIEAFSAQTLRALTQTLDDADGRWLLQAHAGSIIEGEFAAWDQGSGTLLRSRLDRSFFAGDTPGGTGTDVLWIVDYKTATPRDTPLDDFLKHEKDTYKGQLETYAESRKVHLPAHPRTMLALYHPLLPKLTWWEHKT